MLKSMPDAGVYLQPGRAPDENIPTPCLVDVLPEKITEQIKRILFELKRIFG
jgi:hypothetical protein